MRFIVEGVGTHDERWRPVPASAPRLACTSTTHTNLDIGFSPLAAIAPRVRLFPADAPLTFPLPPLPASQSDPLPNPPIARPARAPALPAPPPAKPEPVAASPPRAAPLSPSPRSPLVRAPSANPPVNTATVAAAAGAPAAAAAAAVPNGSRPIATPVAPPASTPAPSAAPAPASPVPPAPVPSPASAIAEPAAAPDAASPDPSAARRTRPGPAATAQRDALATILRARSRKPAAPDDMSVRIELPPLPSPRAPAAPATPEATAAAAAPSAPAPAATQAAPPLAQGVSADPGEVASPSTTAPAPEQDDAIMAEADGVKPAPRAAAPAESTGAPAKSNVAAAPEPGVDAQNVAPAWTSKVRVDFKRARAPQTDTPAADSPRNSTDAATNKVSTVPGNSSAPPAPTVPSPNISAGPNTAGSGSGSDGNSSQVEMDVPLNNITTEAPDPRPLSSALRDTVRVVKVPLGSSVRTPSAERRSRQESNAASNAPNAFPPAPRAHSRPSKATESSAQKSAPPPPRKLAERPLRPNDVAPRRSGDRNWPAVPRKTDIPGNAALANSSSKEEVTSKQFLGCVQVLTEMLHKSVRRRPTKQVDIDRSRDKILKSVVTHLRVTDEKLKKASRAAELQESLKGTTAPVHLPDAENRITPTDANGRASTEQGRGLNWRDSARLSADGKKAFDGRKLTESAKPFEVGKANKGRKSAEGRKSPEERKLPTVENNVKSIQNPVPGIQVEQDTSTRKKIVMESLHDIRELNHWFKQWDVETRKKASSIRTSLNKFSSTTLRELQRLGTNDVEFTPKELMSHLNGLAPARSTLAFLWESLRVCLTRYRSARSEMEREKGRNEMKPFIQALGDIGKWASLLSHWVAFKWRSIYEKQADKSSKIAQNVFYQTSLSDFYWPADVTESQLQTRFLGRLKDIIHGLQNRQEDSGLPLLDLRTSLLETLDVAYKTLNGACVEAYTLVEAEKRDVLARETEKHGNHVGSKRKADSEGGPTEKQSGPNKKRVVPQNPTPGSTAPKARNVNSEGNGNARSSADDLPRPPRRNVTEPAVEKRRSPTSPRVNVQNAPKESAGIVHNMMKQRAQQGRAPQAAASSALADGTANGKKKGRRVTFSMAPDPGKPNTLSKSDIQTLFNDGYDLLGESSEIQKEAVEERASQMGRGSVIALFGFLRSYVEALTMQMEGHQGGKPEWIRLPYTPSAVRAMAKIAENKATTGQNH